MVVALYVREIEIGVDLSTGRACTAPAGVHVAIGLEPDLDRQVDTRTRSLANVSFKSTGIGSPPRLDKTTPAYVVPLLS
jgi:hypothetical protein